MSDMPRRICIDRYVPAELAIRDAIQAVEAMPADRRLTKAVNLLGEAKNSVADFVDGVEPPALYATADWYGIAEQAYAAYALSTGGKTFDGRNMPVWSELPDRIKEAWKQASKAATFAAMRFAKEFSP